MRTFRLLFILAITFIVITPSYSQTNELKKSDKIEVIAGQKYYIHTVEKGQTVYSICKLYGISQKDLTNNNPDVTKGLKLNQELKVPVKEKETKSSDYIYHTVEKNETAYSIAKNNDITVDILFKLNPKAKNGLKIGQDLKIKKKQDQVKPKEIAESKTVVAPPVVSVVVEKKDTVAVENRYLKHKVKKKETLYSISKLYDITAEDILEANPSVKENGLKKGVIINIPTKEFLKEITWINDSSDNIVLSDSVLVDTANCDMSAEFDKSRVMKIGLLLPFELDIKTLQLEIEKQENSPVAIRARTKYFFEFYQGILFALKELKSEGYSFDLYAYNTKKSPYTAKVIITKPEIKQLDFIIGPIYNNVFDTVVKYIPEGIPIINPLMDVSKSDKFDKTIIQNKSSREVLYNQIVNYVTEFDNVNYIVIHSGKENQIELIRKYGLLLKQKNIDSNDTISMHSIDFSTGKINLIKDALVSDKTNIVIIPSDDQGFVTNAITKLHVASVEDSVILVGLEEWQKFNVEIKYFHSLNLTVFKNRYINYDDENVLEFQKKFMAEYGGVPSAFSFVGYDSFIYYVNAYTRLTDNMQFCIDKYTYTGLSQKFEFEKLGNTFINKGSYIIQYKKDLTIELIKK